MSYNRRPYRPYRANLSSPTTLSGEITERQRDFAVRLMASINEAAASATPEGVQAAVTAIGGLVHLPTIVSDAWAGVSKADASSTIDALVGIERALKAARPPEATPEYPGLPALRQRVITTRFFGKCCQCGGPTKAGVDLAVQERGMWQAWCLTCASMDPAERAAAEEAARAEVEQRAREDESLARQLRSSAAAVLLLTGSSLALKARPVFRFALPSATGNNDLDFFKLSVTRNGGAPDRLSVKVSRVIGGHADQPLALKQAVPVLKRLLDTDVPEAGYAFGRHLGYCCRCGRHLTDEASRLAGVGPDCAQQF